MNLPLTMNRAINILCVTEKGALHNDFAKRNCLYEVFTIGRAGLNMDFQDETHETTGNQVDISIVSPVFNEERGLDAFIEAVVEQMDKLAYSWELILVDDGSRDGTLEKLQALRNMDCRVKIISFSRNFGNQIAVTAGLRYAKGKAVITMDSDLQHPPEMLPDLIARWEEGYKYVYTMRSYGKDTGFLKRKTSVLFNSMLNCLSDVDMPEGVSDFRLLDRDVVDYVNSMGENSRFLRAMINWLGFKRIGIPFIANPRFAGNTKFSVFSLLKLSMDAVMGFSVHPLRWITYTGLAIAMLSICYACYVLYEVFSEGIITPGWPTLIVAILFLGGVQLISIGVVGEYIGRIYSEAKRRPLFVIQDMYGIEKKEQTPDFEEKQSLPSFLLSAKPETKVA